LRFYRSFSSILWVFKFFGSFLEPRRPLSNSALHSKGTALGRAETPFFAVARRPVDKEGGKGAPFFAVLLSYGRPRGLSRLRQAPGVRLDAAPPTRAPSAWLGGRGGLGAARRGRGREVRREGKAL